MVHLTALWLPILLSAVAVFVASSIVHMVLKYHQSDYRAMPGEANVMAAMRQEGVGPGHYYVPHCVDPKELANEEVREKFVKGPVGFFTVMPSGVPTMTKQFVLWFVYAVVISLFAAYVAGRALGPGADYLSVFRLAGTAAFLGYAGSSPAESIWKGLPWSITIKHMVDGLIYGLLTGGVFGWLWPGA
ncbi:MAG: hypothetical protein R3325_14105 [Thermoanaerobaculia bacterium]|nr:hypothetical protein [Thermoanaerobaculia bacterium]